MEFSNPYIGREPGPSWRHANWGHGWSAQCCGSLPQHYAGLRGQHIIDELGALPQMAAACGNWIWQRCAGLDVFEGRMDRAFRGDDSALLQHVAAARRFVE